MSVKKKLIVYGVYGLIKVDERIWRGSKGSYQRLLPSVLGVTHRGYTHSLQRAMSDFGLDESFCKAAAKNKEHYGFELKSRNRFSVRSAEGIPADWCVCLQAPRLSRPRRIYACPSTASRFDPTDLYHA